MGRQEGKEREGKEEEEKGGQAAAGHVFALAYATDDRVVGVVALDLDGSPYGQVGVVAHTGAVTGLVASATSGQLFSGGGEAVSIWNVSEGGLRAGCRPSPSSAAANAAATPPAGMKQFNALLEGGEGGEEYTTVADTFTYGQIHAQGERTRGPRAGGKYLPLVQLPTLLRGLGYFPSAWEEGLFMEEARAAATHAPTVPGGGAGTATATATGGAPAATSTTPSVIDLPNVIRLLVNHRPARSTTAWVVEEESNAALGVLLHAGGPLAAATAGGYGMEAGTGGLKWGDLARLLCGKGDALGAAELEAVMGTLLESEERAGEVLLTRQLAASATTYGPPGEPPPLGVLNAVPAATRGAGGGGGGPSSGGGGGAVRSLRLTTTSSSSSSRSLDNLPTLSTPPMDADMMVEMGNLVSLLKNGRIVD